MGYNEIVRLMINEGLAKENEDTFVVVDDNVTLEKLIRYSFSLVHEVHTKEAEQYKSLLNKLKF